MHASNFTLYQLVKYHIELTEAMEYSLITYKYNEGELIQRLNFLKSDYKKGFYHQITSSLFRNSKRLTKDIKTFIKTYNQKKIEDISKDSNLHSRINYNNKLYLAYASSNNIIQVFLNEEEIKKDLENSLIDLIKTTNNHFILFCLFDSLNMYISSKFKILSDNALYTLEQIDKDNMLKLLNTIKNDINQKSLIEESFDLINEKKKFNEDDAYELLNKVSIECMKSENDLYTNFDKFTNDLEKEIENGHK